MKTTLSCTVFLGMMSAMSKVGCVSIPLAELLDVSFGGVDGSGIEDDEDDDEMTISPCLNKVSG